MILIIIHANFDSFLHFEYQHSFTVNFMCNFDITVPILTTDVVNSDSYLKDADIIRKLKNTQILND